MLSSKRALLVANRFVVKAAIANRELLVVNIYFNRTRNRLANNAGWELIHVCIDETTRLAYAEVPDDERAASAVGFP